MYLPSIAHYYRILISLPTTVNLYVNLVVLHADWIMTFVQIAQMDLYGTQIILVSQL